MEYGIDPFPSFRLLDQSYDVSSIRVVATGESDTAFLAMGGDRPLQEMRNYVSTVSTREESIDE